MNLFEWLFSKQCPLCGIFQENNNVCFSCFKNFSFLNHACIKCQEPFNFHMDGVEICDKCMKNGYDFYNTMHSALIYNEFLKNLIVSFKNGSNFFLAKLFAKFIINSANDVFEGDAILIPVPLFQKRLIMRGYNQSYILAKEISKIKKIPVANNILFRKRDTNSQALKKIAQRYENVKDAFDIYSKNLVYGKKFILIDDVITTGATMFECAKILHEYGAKQIHLVSLARRIKKP